MAPTDRPKYEKGIAPPTPRCLIELQCLEPGHMGNIIDLLMFTLGLEAASKISKMLQAPIGFRVSSQKE